MKTKNFVRIPISKREKKKNPQTPPTPQTPPPAAKFIPERASSAAALIVAHRVAPDERLRYTGTGKGRGCLRRHKRHLGLIELHTFLIDV